jgi:hypothetical protein
MLFSDKTFPSRDVAMTTERDNQQQDLERAITADVCISGMVPDRPLFSAFAKRILIKTSKERDQSLLCDQMGVT